MENNNKLLGKENQSSTSYIIDREMLSSKATYFLQSAKDSCYKPYMMLFLTSIGLGPAKAGQINGLRYIGFIIGAPLWGMLADHKRVHRSVVLMLCIMSIIVMCSQPLVSTFLGDPSVNRCPVNRLLNYSKANATLSMTNNQSLIDTNKHMIPVDTSILYYVMLALNIIASCFDGSIVVFADTGVMQKISQSSQKADFGRQRLFGPIGYGCGALLTSIAIDNVSKMNTSCYSAVFCVYFAFVACLAVSTNILYKGFSVKLNKNCKAKTSGCLSTVLIETLKRWHTLFFLATVLFVGLLRGLYLSFLFLFLKNELKATNLILGISIACGSISSIFTISFSTKLIILFHGTMSTICLACISWFVRFLCFAYLHNAWIVLPVQLLHGIGYGMFITASVKHVKLISPPAISATMYGIMNSLNSGAGFIIANVAGGVLYQTYGPRKMFLAASIGSFIWALFIILYLLSGKLRKQSLEMRGLVHTSQPVENLESINLTTEL